MATSSTYTFTLDLADIVQEAFEQCGLEFRTGRDFDTAKTSLGLLLTEWQNRGINFWTVGEETLALTSGTGTYSLTSSPPIQDILEFHIRTGSGTSQRDIPVTRISVSQYASIPNKAVTGRPVNVYFDRQRDNPQLYLWPVPDQNYTLAYWRIREAQDAGSGLTDQDVPKRFLPALTAGLAHRIAAKRSPERSQELKLAYEEQWRLAVASDRDRAPFRLVPRIARI